MCGLVGYITKDGKAPAVSVRQLKRALLRCSVRGTDATGVFWEEDNDYKIFKAPLAAEHFASYIPWDRVIKSPLCMMHTRSMTQGTSEVFTNNHPLVDGRRILAHNGMIANSDDFVENSVCDSLAIFEALKLFDSKDEVFDLSLELVADALAMISGTVAFTLFDTKSKKLFLLASGNPLVIGQKENTIFWASTTKIVRSMRPYMISEMLPDYLVCINKDFMKGKKVDIPTRIARTSYNAALHSYYNDFNNHDDPRTEVQGGTGWYTYNATKSKYELVSKKEGAKKRITRKVASAYHNTSTTKQTSCVVGDISDGEATVF